MKRLVSFWESLEQYSWKLVGRSPLPRYWMWVGIGLVGAVLLASGLNMKDSVVSAKSMLEVTERAAALGDYALARDLYEKCQVSPCQSVTQQVLGAESGPPDGEAGLEDRVYPERVVTRRIAELEEKLETYPENKEIYLMLAGLYDYLGNTEKSGEYREKARVLDPNGAEFR